MGPGFVMFPGETVRRHQLIKGGRSACSRGLLDLGLRFQVDRQEGLVLGRMTLATEG